MTPQETWDELLLQGWHRDLPIWNIVHRLVDQFREEDDAALFAKLERAPPHKNIGMWANVPIKAAFRENWPKLSDALWDGLSYEAAKQRLQKRKWVKDWPRVCMHNSKPRSGKIPLFVHARELTKKHDWNTVK